MEISAGTRLGLGGMIRSEERVPPHIENPDLYKACRGFESYFVRYMITKMRGSMNLMGGKEAGSETYQGMFDNALSEEIAKKGAIGIAEMMYRQLMKQQGTGQGLSAAINPVGNTEKRIDSYEPIIAKAAKKYNLDPELIRAVIRQESGGRQYAVSSKGARGLMQLMNETAAELGVVDAFDPAQNIDGGARYLSRQLDRFGDIRMALAAYNAGPERVIAAQGIPQITETQQYVANIMRNYNGYKNQDGKSE